MESETQKFDNIAIVANGTLHQPELMRERIATFPYVIAADGGLENCHKMGVIPNLIIGDLDSAPQELLKQYSSVKTLKYPREKDKTDLEIAVEKAIDTGAVNIVIFAALEKRIDHSLYNLNLLRRHPTRLSIESEFESVFVVDRPTTAACAAGSTISLLPLFGPVEGISSKGLKWELNNQTLDHHFMSISNICLENSFYIDLKTNVLLCCICK